MSKICCFGELLLRMSPSLNRQWIKESSMPVYVGGAELNVANALSLWGMQCKYVTALPDHYLSREILEHLQHSGIDTANVQMHGERIGLYYLPQGADLKHAGVIYDRDYSSFAGLQRGTIDWREVLKDCSWLHLSAISPALNESVAAVCEEAAAVASEMGLSVSIDLNYRAKLWKYGKDPVSVMPPIMQHCNVVMGNMWAAESLLGVKSPLPTSDGQTASTLVSAAEESMQLLRNEYPGVTTIAYTFRMDNRYWAVIGSQTEMAVSKSFELGETVDRVGSGDCFMAGLLYGIHHYLTLDRVANFAAAAAVGKLYEKGDATRQSVAQIQKNME